MLSTLELKSHPVGTVIIPSWFGTFKGILLSISIEFYHIFLASVFL